MAEPFKRGSKWVVQVYKNGIRKAGSFNTKAEANAWKHVTEMDIAKSSHFKTHDKTVADLLIRYQETITVSKLGFKQENNRINRFLNDPISSVNINEVGKRHIAEWRDRRLESVSGSTVNREWSLLSNCFNIAIHEWEWMSVSPMIGVKCPKESPHRDRLISQDEIDDICYVLGYKKNEKLITTSARVGAAFLFAIETAMRAQEICFLNFDDVNIKKSFATVNKSKTDSGIRDVPLTDRAVELVNQLAVSNNISNAVFNLSVSQLDSLFRKARDKTPITDLHFHDTRHEAVTRLSRWIPTVQELARAIGHKNLNMLSVYYNERAENIATRMNAKIRKEESLKLSTVT